MKKFVYIAALIIVSACSKPTYDLPHSYPKDAPEPWKMGWEDGCKSGFSAYGNSFYKTFYSFTQRREMLDDPTYYKSWNDSFNYCRAYINRYLAGDSFYNDPNAKNVTAGLFKEDQFGKPVSDREFSIMPGAGYNQRMIPVVYEGPRPLYEINSLTVLDDDEEIEGPLGSNIFHEESDPNEKKGLSAPVLGSPFSSPF